MRRAVRYVPRKNCVPTRSLVVPEEILGFTAYVLSEQG